MLDDYSTPYGVLLLLLLLRLLLRLQVLVSLCFGVMGRMYNNTVVFPFRITSLKYRCGKSASTRLGILHV